MKKGIKRDQPSKLMRNSIITLTIIMLIATVAAFRFPSIRKAFNFKQFQTIADQVDHNIKSNDIMVFSKTYCPYCKRAKAAITDLNVKFNVIELDVSSFPEYVFVIFTVVYLFNRQVDKDGAEIQAALLEKTGS